MGTTGYPGALDDFSTTSPTNLGDDDSKGRKHDERHDDMESAMEAVQAELGVDPAGTAATVKARLDATEWNVTKSGRWVVGTAATVGTLSMAANTLYGVLYPVNKAHSLDTIGVVTTVAGATGSVIRLGIYKADDNGADFSLILDAGTVDGTTTATAVLSISIDQALTPGVYLLVAVGQGAPATQPTVRNTGAGGGLAWMMSHTSQDNTSNTMAGLSTTSVTGALPSSITPVIAASVARVQVRIK